MTITPPTRPLWTLTLALASTAAISPGVSAQTAVQDLKDAAAEVNQTVKEVQAVAEGTPPLAATLDAVDDAAEVTLIVPSMSRLSEALAAFSDTTGLTPYAPDLEDALGTFKRQMSFDQGVDDEGPVLIVVRGLGDQINARLDNAGEVPEPKALVLVPVSDYDAFVKGLGGDPSQKVASITVQDKPGHAMKMGGYAVLGGAEEADLVQNYTGANAGKAWLKNLTPMLGEYAEDADMMVYVDLRKLGAPLKRALDEGLKQAKMEMDDAAANNEDPMGMAGIAEGMMQLYGEAAQSTLDGADSVLFTLNLTDGGLGLTMSMRAKADSQLAAFFAPAPGKPGNDKANAGGMVSAKLLASVPDRPFLYAAAIDQTAFPMQRITDRVTAALDGQAKGAGTGLVTLYTDMIRMMGNANGVASVFYAPEAAGMMTGGLFSTLTLYGTEDPAAFIAQQKANTQKLGDLAVPLDAPAEGDQPGAQLKFDTTYADTALKIEGVNVDQYNVTMRFPPEMTRQFNPMIAALAGGGYGGYIAPKNDIVMVTTVTDPQFITRAIQAVGKDEGIGTAGALARLRSEELPPQPMMELYISLDGLTRTANLFLPMLTGMPEIEIPDDLPPVALGAAADQSGQGVSFRLFIPTDAVSFGVGLYDQFAPEGQDPTAPAGRRAPR